MFDDLIQFIGEELPCNIVEAVEDGWNVFEDVLANLFN